MVWIVPHINSDINIACTANRRDHMVLQIYVLTVIMARDEEGWLQKRQMESW